MKTFSAVVALFAASAVASPVSSAVSKRQPDPHMAITVFADTDYWGRQQDFTFGNRGDCLSLANGWNNVISSVHVWTGWRCDLYWNGDCTGGYWPFLQGDYPSVPANFNDNVNSIKCGDP